MRSIIITILGVFIFLAYAGINAIVIYDIFDNYENGFDYFISVFKNEKINFRGKVAFIIFNLLFPLAALLPIFVSLVFLFEESGYAKLKKWFIRVFTKK